MKLKLKRVHDPPEQDDGTRILVDRLWPRGMTKERAQVDLWMKEIAPSTELRKSFCHDAEKWDEFKRRYTRELVANAAQVALLRNRVADGPVTLLYAAKDEQLNNAIVLRDFLDTHPA